MYEAGASISCNGKLNNSNNDSVTFNGSVSVTGNVTVVVMSAICPLWVVWIYTGIATELERFLVVQQIIIHVRLFQAQRLRVQQQEQLQ
jgi:Flp pilus assembly protein TadG